MKNKINKIKDFNLLKNIQLENPTPKTLKDTGVSGIVGKGPNTNIFTGTKSVLTYNKNHNKHNALNNLGLNMDKSKRGGNPLLAGKPKHLFSENKLILNPNILSFIEETTYLRNKIKYKPGEGGSTKASAVPHTTIQKITKETNPLINRQNTDPYKDTVTAMNRHQGLNYLRKNDTMVRQALMNQSKG